MTKIRLRSTLGHSVLAAMAGFSLVQAGGSECDRPTESITEVIRTSDRARCYRLDPEPADNYSRWGVPPGVERLKLGVFEGYPILSLGPELSADQFAFLKMAILIPEHHNCETKNGTRGADIGFAMIGGVDTVNVVIDFAMDSWFMHCKVSGDSAEHFLISADDVETG